MTTEANTVFKWWCFKCEAFVPDLQVTFEEVHDGCGGQCGDPPVKLESEIERQQGEIRSLIWERDAFKDTLQSCVELMTQADTEIEQLRGERERLARAVVWESNKGAPWKDDVELARSVLAEGTSSESA